MHPVPITILGCKSTFDCRDNFGQCDLNTNQCVECLLDSDCQHANETCSEDHRCQVKCPDEKLKCKEDEDCAESPQPYCDETTEQCVSCTIQEHCLEV